MLSQFWENTVLNNTFEDLAHESLASVAPLVKMSTVYESQAHSFGDLIELVRQGYKTAALPYHEQKDTSVLTLPIYHHWLSLVPEGYVAEIGTILVRFD